MADKFFIGIALLVFVASAFLVEAIWQWWFSTQSKAARRTRQRLQASRSAAQAAEVSASLWLQRPLAASPAVEVWLKKIPGIELTDRFLRQAGSSLRVDQLLISALAFFFVGLVVVGPIAGKKIKPDGAPIT